MNTGREPPRTQPASPEASDDLAALYRDIEQARGEIFALKRRLSEREREIESLLASTSWRITSPMRSTGNWAKARRWFRRAGVATGPNSSIDRFEYRAFVAAYSTIDPLLRERLTARVNELPARPVISVIMPSYNIKPDWMEEAIESVRRQIYPYWQLCISDDASTIGGVRELLERVTAEDKRIRVVFRTDNGHISANSNSALDLATGNYVALMDADDLLSADALYCVAREIANHPDVDLIFSDEDKIDEAGERFDPLFKPAWNPALMLSQNAFCHLGVFRRSLVEAVGRFREGYEGAQDHDLVLRCAEASAPERIRHIPRVLYHWRASPHSTARASDSKPYASTAGCRVIEGHLRRVGVKARVDPAGGDFFQVIYEPTQTAPLVSIIVPTTLQNALTTRCLQSVLRRTRYENFELVLAATDEDLAAARGRDDVARLLNHERVRTVVRTSAPFNFSAVNNASVPEARGQLLCFLNDDVEVISADWLTQLVARVSLAGVGGAGPMLYYPSNRIQEAGVLLGVGGVADHAFRNLARGEFGYFGRAVLEQDYNCLTAACLLVRRDLFESVGGFDASLPVAFNDVDLCIRMRRTGARLVWVPSAQMYHHESITFGPHDSPDRAAQFDRDVQAIRARWLTLLNDDPAYNPNLSLDRNHQFQLATPPRTLTAAQDGEPGSALRPISRTCLV